MKQTAIEWLVDMLDIDKNDSSTKDIIEQAKAMEKEQREKDLESGFHVGRLYQGREGDTTLEQLKERTFKSESFCNCPKGKGIDFDENQKAYCIDCGKNINL